MQAVYISNDTSDPQANITYKQIFTLETNSQGEVRVVAVEALN